MEPVWQLQEAKARFSELFQKALDQGPQRVTRRGRESVVLIPADDYEQMIGGAAQRIRVARRGKRLPPNEFRSLLAEGKKR
jgi:prevent-host-death family protein